MKTGNTDRAGTGPALNEMPQWSPVMKTGNTRDRPVIGGQCVAASMEPGHEDREYDMQGTRCQGMGLSLNGARS